MCACVKQKSRISPRCPTRRLGRVTRGTECKKILRGLVSFSSRKFIGATRRDLGNAHALKYQDGPRRVVRETNENVTFRSYLSLSVSFLGFIITTSSLRPLFQIIHIYKVSLFLTFLLFSCRIKVRCIRFS